MVICSYCQASDAKHHCGRCNSVFYCKRECQVAHWAYHKSACKRSSQSETPRKGDFSITKTINGTKISFGYEAKAISLQERNEFERAVAAVERAGVEPPPLTAAGETVIKLAVVPFGVPTIGVLWMQESLYGDNCPPEIRKVQEIASRLTGASHMFYLMMQMPNTSLTPPLSCKSLSKNDLDTAMSYVSKKYLTQTWCELSCSHFLYLLKSCYKLELHLLEQAHVFQERSQQPVDTWPTKDQDMTALKEQLETTEFFRAGEDLYEMLLELVRRSKFDSSMTVPYRRVDGPIENCSAADVHLRVEDLLQELALDWNYSIALPSSLQEAILLEFPARTEASLTVSDVATPSMLESSSGKFRVLRTFENWSTVSMPVDNRSDYIQQVATTALLNAHLHLTNALFSLGDESTREAISSLSSGEREMVEEAVGLHCMYKICAKNVGF